MSSNYAFPLVLLIVRAGIAMTMLSTYLTNNRFFPPEILATTFGLFNFFSHIPAIVAPLIVDVVDPMLVVAILSFIGMFAIRFVEEMPSYKEGQMVH